MFCVVCGTTHLHKDTTEINEIPTVCRCLFKLHALILLASSVNQITSIAN